MKDILQERNVASRASCDGRRCVEYIPGDTDEVRGDSDIAHFFVDLTPQFPRFVILLPLMRIPVPVGSCMIGYDAVSKGGEQIESPLRFPIEDGPSHQGDSIRREPRGSPCSAMTPFRCVHAEKENGPGMPSRSVTGGAVSWRRVC